MNRSDNDDFSFVRFKPSDDSSIVASATTNQRASSATPVSIEISNLEEIIVNLHVKFNYAELHSFVRELQEPNEHMKINGQSVSILHLYALQSTKDPVDMSNQTKRINYRPNLLVRKNDMYGPWNFKYLLDLFEIDYQCPSGSGEFPKVWKTNMTTKVHIKVLTKFDHCKNATETNQQAEASNEDITLIGLLKNICSQNKCDESDANIWLKALKGTIFL